MITVAPGEKRGEKHCKSWSYHELIVIKIKIFLRMSRNFKLVFPANYLRHKITVTDGLAFNILFRMLTGHTWWFCTENGVRCPANRMISILSHQRCWDPLLLKATSNFRKCFKICVCCGAAVMSFSWKRILKKGTFMPEEHRTMSTKPKLISILTWLVSAKYFQTSDRV